LRRRRGGRGVGPYDRRIRRDLERHDGAPRWTAERIRFVVARVLCRQLCLTLKRGPAKRAIRAAVHRLRRERARERAANEHEALILKRSAHAVVARGALNDEDVPSALERADEIPTAVAYLPILIELRRSRASSTSRVGRGLDPRCCRDLLARLVPGLGPRLIQPRCLCGLRLCDAALRQERRDENDRDWNEYRAHGSFASSSPCFRSLSLAPLRATRAPTLYSISSGSSPGRHWTWLKDER